MSDTATRYHVKDELLQLLVPIEQLQAHPRNPRRNTLDQIAESLQTHGQYRAIVAQLDGTVLAGNHTLAAARTLGWTHLAAHRLDVDEEQALRIMLVDNRSADLATYDDSALLALLDEIAPHGFDGTGYTQTDFDQLLASLDDGEIEVEPRYHFDVYERDVVERAAFEHYRSVGFPYPQRVPLHVAMLELNALALLDSDTLQQTRLGYRVADGYHPHRFDVKVTGKTPPSEVFADDRLLRIAIAGQLDDGGSFEESTFRARVSLTRGGQAAANFRPGFALAMLRKFAPHDGGTMLDCSTGFGGRLVGFLASHCDTYVGVDPSTRTHTGNLALVDDLCPASKHVQLINLPVEDVDVDTLPRCDVAFTSPPYFAKERYADESTQSFVRYRTADAWRDGFLVPMLRCQHSALVDGAFNVVNIADVTIGGHDVPLVEMTCDAARSVGFDVVRIDEFRLSHRWGAHQSDEVAVEPVIVLRKT